MMKALTLSALAFGVAALSGCYTEPKVVVNTPAAPATTAIVTPAPGTAIVVPAR